MSRENSDIFIIIRNSLPCIRRLFPVLSDFTFILPAQLPVDQPQQFSVFIIIEYSIMQCVCKMLQPQPVADRVAVTDNCFRSLCSLRIGFSFIVGKIFLIYNFLFRCHKASQIQILFRFPPYPCMMMVFIVVFIVGFLSFTLKFPARVRNPRVYSKCGKLRWKSSVRGFFRDEVFPSCSFR